MKKSLILISMAAAMSGVAFGQYTGGYYKCNGDACSYCTPKADCTPITFPLHGADPELPSVENQPTVPGGPYATLEGGELTVREPAHHSGMYVQGRGGWDCTLDSDAKTTHCEVFGGDGSEQVGTLTCNYGVTDCSRLASEMYFTRVKGEW